MVMLVVTELHILGKKSRPDIVAYIHVFHRTEIPRCPKLDYVF